MTQYAQFVLIEEGDIFSLRSVKKTIQQYHRFFAFIKKRLPLIGVFVIVGLGYALGHYTTFSSAAPSGNLCGASQFAGGFYSTYCDQPCGQGNNTCHNYLLSKDPRDYTNGGAVSTGPFPATCNTDADCPQELACGIMYTDNKWSGAGKVACNTTTHQCESQCHATAQPGDSFVNYNIISENNCYPRVTVDGQKDTVDGNGFGGDPLKGPRLFTVNEFYTIDPSSFACKDGVFKYSFTNTSSTGTNDNGNDAYIEVKDKNGTATGCSIDPIEDNETRIESVSNGPDKKYPVYWNGRGCGTFYPDYNRGWLPRGETITYDSSKVERGRYGVQVELNKVDTGGSLGSGSSRKTCIYEVKCNADGTGSVQPATYDDPSNADCELDYGSTKVDPASVKVATCDLNNGKIDLNFTVKRKSVDADLEVSMFPFYFEPYLQDTRSFNGNATRTRKWDEIFRGYNDPNPKNWGAGVCQQLCVSGDRHAACDLGSGSGGCAINNRNGFGANLTDLSFIANIATGTKTFTVGGSTDQYRVDMESTTATGSCQKDTGNIISCAPSVTKGNIIARVFEDINNNGAVDPGEVGVAGTRIKLRKGGPNSTSAPTYRPDQTTDGSGSTTYADLPADDDYHVSIEALTPGYSLIPPGQSPQTIVVLSGYDMVVYFIVTKNVAASGRVYYDKNFNSKIDGGDGLYKSFALPSLLVKLNPGATSGLDGGSGYIFNDLIPGNYTISVNQGRKQFAFPDGTKSTHVVNLQATRTDLDFLVQPWPVGGRVFLDANRNGTWELGESLVKGIELGLCPRSQGGCPGNALTMNTALDKDTSTDTIRADIKALVSREYNYVLAGPSTQELDVYIQQPLPSPYALNPLNISPKRIPKYESGPDLHTNSDFALIALGKIHGTVYRDSGFNLCQSGTTLASETVTIQNTTNPGDSYTFNGVGAYNKDGLIGDKYSVSTTYNIAAGETTIKLLYNNFQKSAFYADMILQSDYTVNFCITSLKEWMQTVGGDVRYAGVLNNVIPPAQLAATHPFYPSVFFSSTNSVNIRPLDRVSAKKWRVEGDFNSLTKSSGGQLSYSFFTNLVKRKGLTSQKLSAAFPTCDTASGNCRVGNFTTSGIYHLTDDVAAKNYVLDSTGGGVINISGNRKIILIVNGSVEIKAKIKVAADGSIFILAAKDNISVNEALGTAANDDDPLVAPLQGIFTAEDTISIPSATNACNLGNNPDLRLNIAGTLITNSRLPFAKNGTGQFSNKRSLCPDLNLLYPAVKIFDRFDFITALDDIYKNQRSIWKEVQP